MDVHLKLKRNTERSDRVLFRVAATTTSILALSAAILSFSALQQLALQAGYGGYLSYLFPITLDGLIISGSALTLFAADRGERSYGGIALTALGVIGSIVGNVAVSEQTFLAQAVHAVPPTVLFLSLEGLTSLMRRRINESIARDRIEIEEELAQEKAKQSDTPSQTPVKTKTVNRAVTEKPKPTIYTPDTPLSSVSEAPDATVVNKETVQSNAGRGYSDEKPSIPMQARQLLQTYPEAEIAELANMIDGNDKKYIRRVLRKQREKLSTSGR